MEHPDRSDDEFNTVDPLKSHFEDPELNRFIDGVADGMNALDLRDKTKLHVRYPRAIDKNGLKNIMSSFGKVTRVFVHNNDKFKRYSVAFVDYETFAEAERAIRGLNSGANAGLDIRAEISHGRKKTSNENPETSPSESETAAQRNGIQDDQSDEEEREPTINPIDFAEVITPNENREKVTQFEHHPYQSDFNTILSLKDLEAKAKESMWTYSDNYETAQFDPEGARSHFCEFLCLKCKQPTTFCDDETKNYYCSLKCFESTQEPEIMAQVPLKKSDIVCITSIINEKCIYVRRIGDDLDHLLEQIYRAAKGEMAPLEMIPDIGEEILAKAFDGIYRAQVLEIIDDDRGMEIGVQLIDVGCTVNVTMENLFEMAPACRTFPQIVHKIHLEINVPAINMEVIQYLVFLRDDKVDLLVKSVTEREHKIFVKLKDGEGSLMSEKISRLAELQKVDITPVLFEELTSNIPTEGTNQKLFVVHKNLLASYGTIWCIEEKFMKDFYEMQKALNEYGKKVHPETYGANVQELCMAKIKDQWYRAVIIEKRGDEYPTCILVDLSETCNVFIKNIFRIPKIFTAYPMYSECYEVQNYLKTVDKKKKVFNSYIRARDYIVVDEMKDTPEGQPVVCFKELN